ncbi:MAG: PKD domain-containing protein, partial [Methanoregula sp.]|nr:PKD domain-containing protein [Methanoregula sp.]
MDLYDRRFRTGFLLIFLALLVIPAMATAPTAGFTATPRQGLAPLPVQFTDTTTGSPASWAWDFNNDGTTDSTDQNPSYTFTSVGTYTVTLTATNSDGSNSITKTSYIAALTQQQVPEFSPTNIYVANDGGVKNDYPDGTPTDTYVYIPNTYYLWFDTAGGGLNAPHISTEVHPGSAMYGGVYTTRDQSGSFYSTMTGGRGSYADGILMLAVNGTIPDDFSVHIKSTDDSGTIVTDETFTKNDFYYGPQLSKPSSSAGYPIFYGQDTSDTSNTFQLMFIDLNSGAAYVTGGANNGAIKVEYSFTNLNSFAAFGVYGWQISDNHGTGIHMTNDVTSAPS